MHTRVMRLCKHLRPLQLPGSTTKAAESNTVNKLQTQMQKSIAICNSDKRTKGQLQLGKETETNLEN